MKKPLNIKKFLLPNIPYVFIALFATKLGQAWQLAHCVIAIDALLK